MARKLTGAVATDHSHSELISRSDVVIRRVVLSVVMLLSFGLVLPLKAGLLEDQAQPAIDHDRGPLAIDNRPESQQRLAQTFTVGRTGDMLQIRVPVGCESGTLILELTEVGADGKPGPRLFRHMEFPAFSIGPHEHPWFKILEIRPAMAVTAGQQYALTLSNNSGACSILQSPLGNLYPAGQAFFDARPNPPGWVPLGDKALTRSGAAIDDIPFITLLGDNSERLCSVPGIGEIDFVDFYAPVCRCFEDAILVRQRCAYLHPRFMLLREILPRSGHQAGQRIRWTLTAFEPLESGPMIKDQLLLNDKSIDRHRVRFPKALKTNQVISEAYELVGDIPPGALFRSSIQHPKLLPRGVIMETHSDNGEQIIQQSQRNAD